MKPVELKEFANDVRARVNSFMESYIDRMDNDATNLKEAMKYGLLLGGKRSRPLLVYATGRAFSQSMEKLDYAAGAIECIHAYSLIHDDMPEMDNDRLRRGQDTVHVRFGQTVALLAGDALQTLAFEILSDTESGLTDRAVASLTRILSSKSGYTGMCGGQAIDLDSEGKHLSLDKLRLLHSKKTGALIRAAVLMGAACAEVVDTKIVEILDRYATYTGLAFQVRDDVLDVIGDTQVMGKTQGADESLDKSTYPSLMGLERAQNFAVECADNAIKSLKELPEGIDTSVLEQFALFTVNRDH
ncbi:MAG: (2E,6E)-farnesyl diphosphate synthase [Succinivibrio sp.]